MPTETADVENYTATLLREPTNTRCFGLKLRALSAMYSRHTLNTMQIHVTATEQALKEWVLGNRTSITVSPKHCHAQSRSPSHQPDYHLVLETDIDLLRLDGGQLNVVPDGKVALRK